MNQNKFLFSITCFFYVLFSILLTKLLNTNELLFDNLSQKLTNTQIEEIFKFQEKWENFGYFFIFIIYFIKVSFVSSSIYIGVFFYSKEKIEFKSILNCVLNAELIFCLIPILKLLWFYLFVTNYTLEDIQYFYPLSALNITGYLGLEPWLIYPLQVLNLFEVAYIIYLSYQIGFLTKTNADNGLKIVGYSYLPALLLWVTVVMFFTLNYS
jgi:hypothetical protein